MKHSQPSPEEPEHLIGNEEAERWLLACCMTNSKFADEAADSLVPEDFTNAQHKILFDRMADLRRNTMPVDRVTVFESLMSRGLNEVVTLSWLADLDKDVPAVKSITGYVQIVRDKARLRRVREIATGVLEVIKTGGNSVEVLADFERQVYRAIPKTTGRLVRLGEFIDANAGALLNQGRDESDHYSTGYWGLDDLTGGIFKQECWLFGAAPGVGKTSIALQIALHNARKNIPVAFYSMEMGKKSLFNRLACQIAAVSVKRFRTGDLSDKERARMADAIDELTSLPFYIDDSHALTPADLMGRTKRAMEEYGVLMGLLDFLQKMRATKSRGSENDRLTEICDDFVGIIKETVPFFVMSQLNREQKKEKRKPALSDLRGSGSIEALGHVIVAPYREETEPGKGDDPGLAGKAEFLVLKNREGETRNLKMRFIGWRMMYEDSDADVQTQQQESVDF